MPVMPTKDEFSVLTATDYNQLAREIERLARGLFGSVDTLARPTVTARLTGAYTFADSTDTPVPFTQASPDPDGMFDISVPTRLTVRTPGTWLWFAQASWGLSSVGTRAARIVRVGSSDALGSDKTPGQNDGEGTKLNFSGLPTAMNVNDQVYLNMWQNSGGPMPASGTYGGTWLAGVWLGPLLSS